MQGGSTLSLTIIVFSIEIKILLETIRPPAHYGKGEKSEKFGKSIWRKYGQWFILTKERKQTSLENQFGENTASG